jgi:acetolactate synthase-1/2/3 large subunit
VATLILPSDVLWSAEGAAVRTTAPAAAETAVEAVERAARLLRGGGADCVLLLGGDALRRPGLDAAAKIAAATGARVLAEKSPARHERGAGTPHVDRLAYAGETAAAQLGAPGT